MLHTLENGILRVQISDKGAELQSMQTADGHEYLWQGDARYWEDRAVNLFPTVGRLHKARCAYEGQPYDMCLHGFAQHKLFEVSGNDTEVTFTLTDDEETRKQYPFSFVYRVCYRLKKNRLEVRYEVENCGENTMYFGLGGHPGFIVPMENGCAFEEYQIRLPFAGQTERILFSAAGLTAGQVPYALEERCIPLQHDLFDDDAIVLTNTNCCAIIERKGVEDGRRVTVEYPQMPYIGFWHADHTEAPFVCIEPWQSLPGRDGVEESWELRPGMIKLEKAECYSNDWAISLE